MKIEVKAPAPVKPVIQVGDIVKMAGNAYIVMLHRRITEERYDGKRYDVMSLCGNAAWVSGANLEEVEALHTSKYFEAHYPSAQFKLVLEVNK